MIQPVQKNLQEHRKRIYRIGQKEFSRLLNTTYFGKTFTVTGHEINSCLLLFLLFLLLLLSSSSSSSLSMLLSLLLLLLLTINVETVLPLDPLLRQTPSAVTLIYSMDVRSRIMIG